MIDKDPDGKKFDKVSRFRCRSVQFEAELMIDINIDIYKLDVSEHPPPPPPKGLAFWLGLLCE